MQTGGGATALEIGGTTWTAQTIFVDALPPFVESQLAAIHKDNKNWLAKENLFRKNNNIKTLDPGRSALVAVWQFTDLLMTMAGRHWGHFKTVIHYNKSAMQPYQVRDQFFALRDLRDLFSHYNSDPSAGQFTVQDRDQFLELTKTILLYAGLSQAAAEIAGLPRDFRTHLLAAQATDQASQWSRTVFDFKIAQRHALRTLGKHFYSTVDEMGEFPLVGKSRWLPAQLIDLSSLDKQLSWIAHGTRDVPAFRLPLFGGVACSAWSRQQDARLRITPRFSYRLRELEVADDRFPMTFDATDYIAYYDTCEALAFELAEWCLKNPGGFPEPSTQELRLRGHANEIFNLSNRNAVAGLNALLVFLDGPDGNEFFLHDRRSPEIAEAQMTYHVVPAGTFQPDSYDDHKHARDFSLRRGVMRELAEELLGNKDIEDFVRDEKDFLEEGPVTRFSQGLQRGSLRVFFMGVGFDPVTTKPEILLCIVVNARELGIPNYKRVFTDNWEGTHFRRPWSNDWLMKFAEDSRMLPAGAACLTLAARHFDELNNAFVR